MPPGDPATRPGRRTPARDPPSPGRPSPATGRARSSAPATPGSAHAPIPLPATFSQPDAPHAGSGASAARPSATPVIPDKPPVSRGLP